MFPDLKGKSMSLLSALPQEEFLHRGLSRVLPRGRVHLDALDPDVPPEGQTHHVQVLASVAEGADEVDVDCKEGDIFRVPAVTAFKGGLGFRYLSCPSGRKGPLWRRPLHTRRKTVPSGQAQLPCLRAYMLPDIPTTSTESTWSTKSLFPKYRVICGAKRQTVKVISGDVQFALLLLLMTML